MGKEVNRTPHEVPSFLSGEETLKMVEERKLTSVKNPSLEGEVSPKTDEDTSA